MPTLRDERPIIVLGVLLRRLLSRKMGQYGTRMHRKRLNVIGLFSKPMDIRLGNPTKNFPLGE
jgi:hypothetical protein